ncbi:cytochrome P450 family protein [Nocardia seriolae]|uniref:Cytochrome P450 n=1 Tax=Nocardia seriolae TaxID=37332 RepID=A0A0B8N9J1_9NOCA|nr:cytochrome P450 [Nocardia seriolae]APA96394.1 Biotin biosynthesis cytochrome P450 [Nocardia seriolae]MTJ61467.1 cytochrome P450 [Nocardia seriolae]MTJ71680.1 cytochrome P450 [Nocardia seriolae]MTJ86499.1 cytochrome P450 [Nocardia seriolae]MTK30492.1 cytochrome P450 [Nocardia seriolae]
MGYEIGSPAAELATEVFELGDEFFDDPHSIYDRLRGRGPVHRVRLPDSGLGWLITDYEVAKAAFTDPAISKVLESPGARATVEAEGGDRHLGGSMFADMMVFYDPPEHTRLRGLVNRAFSGRAMAESAPRITELADELLGGLAAGETVDLLERFAVPLGMSVICELLGVPGADRDAFQRWSTSLLSSEDSNEARAAAVMEFVGYIDNLIRAKGAEPGRDLLSELIAARTDGDRLSHRELISMVFLLLVAGYETTVNLIGNGIAILLADRELQRGLSADPDRIPAFVEEVLRYEAPATEATFRYTTAPIVLGGIEIPRDQLILVSMAAANRDPAQFPDPHRFDPDRTPSNHIAFGHGIHRCVGAPLSRTEGVIAITRLLAAFPDLELAPGTELRWRKSLIVRGFSTLPVRL